MTVRTTLEVWLGVDKKEAFNERWYRASDIDKRKIFYDTYKDSTKNRLALDKDKNCLYGRLVQKYINEENGESYDTWLHNFCFNQLDKDFNEILRAVED